MQKYCIVVSIITWDFCIIVHSRRPKVLVIVKISPSSLSERWRFRSCILYTHCSQFISLSQCLFGKVDKVLGMGLLVCMVWRASIRCESRKKILEIARGATFWKIFFLAGKSYWNSELITKKDNGSINQSIYQSINKPI